MDPPEPTAKSSLTQRSFGLTGTFFDTSLLIAGTIDLGLSSHHALPLMDAVADGPISAMCVS